MATRKITEAELRTVAGLPADPGVHGGHAVVAHAHRPVEGKLKECSGRWLCLSCREGDLPGTWFGAAKCFEVS